MDDMRLIAISDLLASYSKGNFDYEVPVSPNLDEIDTIISGVNMLGEELRATTISRNFFSSIYNAVTDMLFVLNLDGTVRDTNQTVRALLQKDNLSDEHFSSLCHSEEIQDVFQKIAKRLSLRKHGGYQFEGEFKSESDRTIYASCTCSKLINLSEEHEGYLIIAEDITERKETEKRVLRAVLETQDNERKRVADDLHDSLGPELSMAKLLISNLKRFDPSNEKMLELIRKCEEILDNSIQNVREICFNLMPGALDQGGLLDALRQLTEKVPVPTHLDCSLKELSLNKQQQVTLYRVFQEFINNSIRHAKARNINISINQRKDLLILQIEDDGIGFDVQAERKGIGRGLNTMITRIESFGGIAIFTSEIGKGTRLKIRFKC